MKKWKYTIALLVFAVNAIAFFSTPAKSSTGFLHGDADYSKGYLVCSCPSTHDGCLCHVGTGN